MNKEKARKEYSQLVISYCIMLYSILANSKVDMQLGFTLLMVVLFGGAMVAFWNSNLKQ